MAHQVFLSFRELAALAPDAGLYCTFSQAQQLFVPYGSCPAACPEIQDEEDQMQTVEQYAEWKFYVERNPRTVSLTPRDDLTTVAQQETWYQEAIRKKMR